MLITTADLSRYLYIPNRGITLSISGSSTTGDTISTADAYKYMLEAEAKVLRAFGTIPFAFTRVAAELAAGGASVTTDKQDDSGWNDSGNIYIAGRNIAYTSRTATTFDGLSATLGVPAAPVGAFITAGGEDCNYSDAEQAELYRRLELTCKLAAYEIWRLRFNAETMPEVIKDWQLEAMRELSKSLNGEGYAHP